MKRLGAFFLIILGFGLIAGLYVIKTRTQTAYQEVRRLETFLEDEQDAIMVLNAEIAHLESPSRLAELGQTYLQLRPTQAEQMMTLDDLVVRVPRREPAGVSRE